MTAYQSIPPLAGEQIIFAADFTSSPILSNSKSGLVVTPERIAVVHPQHVFVFFQVGHSVSSSSIDKLAEVSVGRLLSRSHLRNASVAALVGFAALVMAMFGETTYFLFSLLAFGVAAFQLWLARHLGLTVQHVGGGKLSVRCNRDEYQSLLAASDVVQQLMIGRKPVRP
jgi:hypothetical protein